MPDENKMKIAILTPVFWTFDGISRAVEIQARELIAGGHDITIFTFTTNMTPPEGVSLRVMGMPESSLGQRIYRLFFLLDFMKVIKYVPELKDFNVIYSHQYPLNWLAYLAKKKYGTKYIYYNHGISPSATFSNFIERTYMKVLTLLANWTIKKADGGISISRYMQSELKRQTGLESEVVYHKIDETRFHKDIDGSPIRRKYNLGDYPVALFVGRISPHKGVHYLIESLKSVRQEIPETRLLIVGKHTFSAYSRKLRKMSDDSVVFTGDVPDEDLPKCYAACDVYATATLWEGFDLPVAEAQACGKPVVAFDIGPHKEIINSEGILVSEGNVKGMAEGIVKIIRKSSHSPV